MNRRGFMKVLLGCSAAAALPAVGKAVSSKPVIAVDMAKPGADRTEMMIGRYEGVRFIESARFVETKAYLESTPSGENAFYAKHINAYDFGEQEPGGYMYSETLRNAIHNAIT